MSVHPLEHQPIPRRNHQKLRESAVGGGGMACWACWADCLPMIFARHPEVALSFVQQLQGTVIRQSFDQHNGVCPTFLAVVVRWGAA